MASKQKCYNAFSFEVNKKVESKEKLTNLSHYSCINNVECLFKDKHLKCLLKYKVQVHYMKSTISTLC